MTAFQSLLIGIVEGLTEFLPISSTGHIMLTEYVMGIPKDDEFVTTYNVAIQCGAIAAVLVLYWRRFLVEPKVLLRVAIACVPTAILGFLFYNRVRDLLENDVVVLWALALGGVFLIVFELWHGEHLDAESELSRLPYWKAALVGLAQTAALVPGVSRAAATIFGGLALRIRRPAIVEFSFLLAVPTMVGATGLKLIKSPPPSGDQLVLLAIGSLTAFAVAWLAIQLLIRFVQSHTFIIFGIYRIALAVAFWCFVMA